MQIASKSAPNPTSSETSGKITQRRLFSITRWAVFGLVLNSAVLVVMCARTPHRGSLPILLAIGVAWWALITMFLVLFRASCRTPSGTELPYMGVPNGLSSIRGWMCWPLAVSAISIVPEQSALLDFVAIGMVVGLLDALDGSWARTRGPITVLGKGLDPSVDALFFALGAVGCYRLGIIPLWLLILIVLRYLIPFVLTPVVYLLGRRPELVHTRWGRRNTALTGFVMFVCLMTLIFHGPVLAVSLIIGLPTLIPTLVLHTIDLWKRVAQSAPSPKAVTP